MHRGVYATFSGEPPRLAQLWAAVLSAGPGAMLSHQTAAELARLTDKQSELVHVTVPSTRRVVKTPGIVVHYSSRARETLHPARLPPQTRIEETVLDLAGAAMTLDDACGWVTRSLQRGLTTQAGLAHYLGLRRKIRWRAELAELLTLDAAGLHSVLELRYRRDVERPHRLPRGTRQARFRRGDHNEYRDVLYEAYQTAVELDGELAHIGEAWRRDARRDNTAAADGIVTLRYSWFDVTKSPCEIAAEVARVLARRGFAGARPCSPKCPVGADKRPQQPTGPVRQISAHTARARTAASPIGSPARPARTGNTNPLRNPALPARAEANPADRRRRQRYSSAFGGAEQRQTLRRPPFTPQSSAGIGVRARPSQ